MAELLKIRSDFTDYYDAPCSAEGGKGSKAVIYDRYRINRTRIADLQELRFLGIRTLDIKLKTLESRISRYRESLRLYGFDCARERGRNQRNL